MHLLVRAISAFPAGESEGWTVKFTSSLFQDNDEDDYNNDENDDVDGDDDDYDDDDDDGGDDDDDDDDDGRSTDCVFETDPGGHWMTLHLKTDQAG